MPTLAVHLFRHSREPFCELLRSHGVQFEETRPAPGTVVAAPEIIILVLTGQLIGAVAEVIVAFVEAHASRRVIITRRDNKVSILTQGIDPAEVPPLVEAAKSITVLDARPRSRKNRQDPD